METSPSHWGWGGLNAFYWYQIIGLDSDVVKSQKMLSLHGGFLSNAMLHHRKNSQIKVTHHNETK